MAQIPNEINDFKIYLKFIWKYKIKSLTFDTELITSYVCN